MGPRKKLPKQLEVRITNYKGPYRAAGANWPIFDSKADDATLDMVMNFLQADHDDVLRNADHNGVQPNRAPYILKDLKTILAWRIKLDLDQFDFMEEEKQSLSNKTEKAQIQFLTEKETKIKEYQKKLGNEEFTKLNAYSSKYPLIVRELNADLRFQIHGLSRTEKAIKTVKDLIRAIKVYVEKDASGGAALILQKIF